MAILVFVDSIKSKIVKASFEAVNYAHQVASKTGDKVVALCYGTLDKEALENLGEYGADQVMHCDGLKEMIPTQIASLVVAAAEKIGVKIIVFSHDFTGKSVAGIVSAKLNAGLVSGTISLPNLDGGFSVKKNVFSGKAIATYEITTDVKIISLLPNSVPLIQANKTCSVELFNPSIEDSRIRIKEQKVKSGDVIPLPEAELVVSAGRGMKGPEHWGMIEELANELGATTACSRPVADIGWRPHHEHVGQTGVAIRPNLYIAIGISGAIQHLAGVNGSKVIVVINKDPEAPFFKAADYGIVGDAFEVVPKLIEAVKEFKATQN